MYKRFLLLLIILFNILIIFWFWYESSGSLLGINSASALLAIGRLAGLLLAFFVLVQVLLISRIRWIEHLMSFDRLTYLHHFIGLGLICALIIHPIFLIIAYARLGQQTVVHQWFEFLFVYDDIAGAVIGALMLISIALLSIRSLKRLLLYEVWYALHLGSYFAIILAFGHQLELGGDFLDNTLFMGYWYLLYTFVFVNLIIYRFLRPFQLFVQHDFRVSRVVLETENIYSVYISGKDIPKLSVEPGQFAIFRFLDKKRWWQAHPFSFSEITDTHIRITIKALGNFTQDVKSIVVGTKVIIDGPHGNFIKSRSTKEKVVCIAGGIGITPIRTLIESLASTKKEISLIYAARSHTDLVFQQEFEKMIKSIPLKIHYVMSDDVSWYGLKGRVDQTILRELVPDISDYDVYLCGPPMMMYFVRENLKQLGVKTQGIFFEKFAL